MWLVIDCMSYLKRLEHGWVLNKVWRKAGRTVQKSFPRSDRPNSVLSQKFVCPTPCRCRFCCWGKNAGENAGAATHIWAPGTAMLTRYSVIG